MQNIGLLLAMITPLNASCILSVRSYKNLGPLHKGKRMLGQLYNISDLVGLLQFLWASLMQTLFSLLHLSVYFKLTQKKIQTRITCRRTAILIRIDATYTLRMSCSTLDFELSWLWNSQQETVHFYPKRTVFAFLSWNT